MGAVFALVREIVDRLRVLRALPVQKPKNQHHDQSSTYRKFRPPEAEDKKVVCDQGRYDREYGGREAGDTGEEQYQARLD